MARKIGPIEAEIIGRRLRSARLAKGTTLIETAARCGMHYTQVSRIERGLFSRLNERVLRLCTLFKIEPGQADGTSPEELHSRLEALIRYKPNLVVALRALFDAFDGIAN